MPSIEPCILHPLDFAAAAPVLRVVTGGVERDCTLSGINDGSLIDWYSAEDSLIAELLDALNALPGGVTWTAALSDNNFLTLTSSGAARLLWTHPNTTLDPTVLGWILADTTSGTTHAAPNATRGFWRGGIGDDLRPCHEDTGDDPAVAVVITRTLDNGARGYDLSPEPSGRRVSWHRLAAARVRPDDALTTEPYSTFQEMWTVGGVGHARVFRWYEDYTDRSSFTEYQAVNGGKPWELEEKNGTPRYTINEIELVEAL